MADIFHLVGFRPFDRMALRREERREARHIPGTRRSVRAVGGRPQVRFTTFTETGRPLEHFTCTCIATFFVCLFPPAPAFYYRVCFGSGCFLSSDFFFAVVCIGLVWSVLGFAIIMIARIPPTVLCFPFVFSWSLFWGHQQTSNQNHLVGFLPNKVDYRYVFISALPIHSREKRMLLWLSVAHFFIFLQGVDILKPLRTAPRHRVEVVPFSV